METHLCQNGIEGRPRMLWRESRARPGLLPDRPIAIDPERALKGGKSRSDFGIGEVGSPIVPHDSDACDVVRLGRPLREIHHAFDDVLNHLRAGWPRISRMACSKGFIPN